MMPSQSSSMLLQISVAGSMPPRHPAQCPVTQVCSPGPAGAHHRVTAAARGAVAAVAPLVDHAVAVLVAAVAVLDAGPDAAQAGAPRAGLARLGAGAAIADAAAARTRHPVDDAVAVVVGAVAGLAAGDGQHLPLTGAPARRARFDHARLRSRLADPDARGRGRAVVAGARLAAPADAAVIHHAVAVVVQLVARLGLGQPAAGAGAPVAADAARARDARLHPVAADADAAGDRRARVAAAHRARRADAAVVDHAVAVVVDPIAQLRARQRLPSHAPHSEPPGFVTHDWWPAAHGPTPCVPGAPP